VRAPVTLLLAGSVTATVAGILLVSGSESPPAGGQKRTTVSGAQVVRGAGSSEPDTDATRDLQRDNGLAGQAHFAISGRVTDLYPGATIPLVLTLTNENSFAISVTSVEVSVRLARSGCGPANIEVGPFHGPVVVAARDSAKAEISVRMVENPDDACQGATFPLDYRGAALPA
jgi:hypothetical protein